MHAQANGDPRVESEEDASNALERELLRGLVDLRRAARKIGRQMTALRRRESSAPESAVAMDVLAQATCETLTLIVSDLGASMRFTRPAEGSRRLLRLQLVLLLKAVN